MDAYLCDRRGGSASLCLAHRKYFPPFCGQVEVFSGCGPQRTASGHFLSGHKCYAEHRQAVPEVCAWRNGRHTILCGFADRKNTGFIYRTHQHDHHLLPDKGKQTHQPETVFPIFRGGNGGFRCVFSALPDRNPVVYPAVLPGSVGFHSRTGNRCQSHADSCHALGVSVYCSTDLYR